MYRPRIVTISPAALLIIGLLIGAFIGRSYEQRVQGLLVTKFQYTHVLRADEIPDMRMDGVQALAVSNWWWKQNTTFMIQEHNTRYPIHQVTVDSMTPERLAQITNPDRVWDWRERSKSKCIAGMY